MAKLPTVTLELRTSRDNEQTAEAMVQFLTALPNPPHGWMQFWQEAPTFVADVVSQGQTIYTLLTVPEYLAEYIHSQLTAAYPEILIKKLEHEPLQEFNQSVPKKFGELILTEPSAYPLKTFRDVADRDPYASVLSTMAKLSDQEMAIIQFTFRKARHHWKNRLQPATTVVSAADPAKTSSNLPAGHREALARKAAQPWLQVSIRVVTQAATKERTEQLFESVSHAFAAFQSQTNNFTTRFPWRKNHFLQHTISRQASWKKTFLTVDELASMWHMPNKQLSTIKNIAWGKNLLGEPPESLPTYTQTPETDRDNVNLFGRVEYKNQMEVFGIKRLDRRRHMYVIGKSGTGKSTLLANMIINDLKHNEGLAVVDPHGDLIETVLNYIPKHRINDVIVLDPADPEAVVKLNLFEGGSLVHRELIASGIVAIFQKMYANSWGPRLEYILRNALLTLLSTNAKLEDVLRILTDTKYRAKVVENLDDRVLRNFWLSEFNVMPERSRVEAVSPILNKVGQFVTSPLIRNVVNTTTSSFDIESVMNDGKILLVNVSQGKLGEDNMSLLGAMIITKIQLAAMNRVYMPEEQRRDFYLYIDEFQNFATTSFVKILSEARKYRLNLILANQYMAQIPDEVKAAIFGNAATMISFILGAQDAEWMVKEFGSRYSQEDLVSLGRYQIIAKLMVDGQVSQPFPANTLNLASSTNKNREKVMRVSRERFARPTEKDAH